LRLITSFLLTSILTFTFSMSQTTPCEENPDVGGVEEPIVPELGEPDPLGGEDIGCFNEYQQWVPGGYIVYFWHDGELLGSECVDPTTQFKQQQTGRFVIREYIALDLGQQVDHRIGAPIRTERFHADQTLLLGIDFDGNGVLGNRLEMLLGHRPAPNAMIGLADFDRVDMGGNNDGYLDASDRIWPHLFFREVMVAHSLTPSDLGIHRIETIPVTTKDEEERLTLHAFDDSSHQVYDLQTIQWSELKTQ